MVHWLQKTFYYWWQFLYSVFIILQIIQTISSVVNCLWYSMILLRLPLSSFIVLSLLMFPSNKMTAYVTFFFSPDDQCVIHFEGTVAPCLLPSGKSCSARGKMLLSDFWSKVHRLWKVQDIINAVIKDSVTKQHTFS